MTNKELSQLYYLNREIKGLEELIEEMESRAECITPNLTGMPHGSGISDKIGSAAVHIATLRSRLTTLHQRASVEQVKIMDYIMLIDDSIIRQIALWRFAYCLKWEDVAEHVNPTMTGEVTRKTWYRWLCEKG